MTLAVVMTDNQRRAHTSIDAELDRMLLGLI